MKFGVHVSIAGSIDRAVDRAADRGCDTFQIFSRNPRGWRARDITPEESLAFSRKVASTGMGPVVDHMPYLPNLASPRDDVYQRSVEALSMELDRCRTLGIPYLVTHLGSHLGRGVEEGHRRIVNAIGQASPDGMTTILLETTAGTKNSIGGRFEEIGAILRSLDGLGLKLGVCLDTCHVFSAGYELRTAEGLDRTMEEFDRTIGLERLRLVHLNDSKGGLGSGVDRHEHIGLGGIGEEGFRRILSHDALRRCPMILETPVDEIRDDLGDLAAARQLADG